MSRSVPKNELVRKHERRRRRQAQSHAIEELQIWPETVQGGRLVSILQTHVEALRDESAHGNRDLFLDDVFIVYLLAFFNPTIRTLRTVEDFSQTKQAQKHLSIRRICKSTLSDFNKIADPQRLQPLIAALRSEIGRKSHVNPLPRDLQGCVKQILAVDGTFLSAAADVAWAVISRNHSQGERYRARVDWHVDIQTWLPEVVVVPETGESEADSAARTITPGAIHLYDRGFSSFHLIRSHYRQQEDQYEPLADFVLRLRKPGGNGMTFKTIEQRPLSDAAVQAHVVSDCIGHLSKNSGLRSITLREVTLQVPDEGMVRLLTNLLDVTPEVIAHLYSYRWQIELFFRWLKCYANFNHLISHSKAGMLLNFYTIVIGVLLMYLHTNGRPSKYLFAMLGMVANGAATLSDIMPILRERERQCARDRASAAKRIARKKAEAS